MWTRQQLKMNAKTNMRKNFLPCVAVSFICSLAERIASAGSAASRTNTNTHNDNGIDVYLGDIHVYKHLSERLSWPLILAIAGVALTFGILFSILVANIIQIGKNRFYIQNCMDIPRVGVVFDGFRSGHYGNIVVTMFLMDLYIFLWSLLFIIPGIIKAYEYYMVPYILAENPGMDRKEAFAISKRMMDGQKMDTFILELSFIGWIIVGICTCGIALIFYVNPYMDATKTELYMYSKAKAFQEGYIH